MKVHIDFESLSYCDLKACGPHRYAQDPSTEILRVAFAVDDSDPLIWYPGYEPSPKYLRTLAKTINVGLYAFNAGFEGSLWSELMVKKYGFPTISQERWHCTATQAYALSLPRAMDAVARAVNLDYQKDKDGAALMRRMCILKKHPAPEIDTADLERLGEYCKQDVIVERELHRRLPPLSKREQAIYVVDQTVNKRGVMIDVPLVQRAVEMIDLNTGLGNAELKRLTDGAVNTVGQAAAIQKFANSRGVEIEDCTGGTLDAQLARKTLDPVVRRVFEIRRSVGRAAIKKYAAMLKAVCVDGRIRDHLMMCGAGRTRRWSGQRLQTQNLVRGYEEEHDIEAACLVLELGDNDLARMLFDDPMVMLSGLVRSMIISGKGQLNVADYSNIEARVLAVISKNQRMLDDYANGLDPYITLASTIFGVLYEQVTKIQRWFCKQAVLGLGYGMGHKTFRTNCAKYGQEITEEFARKVVEIYREQNYMVTELWTAVERDAISTIQTKRQMMREFYGFRWDTRLDALVMILPNESERWYVGACVELREKFGKVQPTITYFETNSHTGKWQKGETYGGKLVENRTQSIARELQADALLAVDAAGRDIVLHAHDEIGDESDRPVDELIQMMTTASPWASAWPIGADGWTGPRYRK